MTGLLNLSEAAALAIHTMVLLSGNTGKLITTRQIATTFHASENHLAKVMQQLVRNDLAVSTRGPSGGFRIQKSLEKITLMDIYEAIDGKFNASHCLFHDPVCRASQCILGTLSQDLHQRVYDYFRYTTLEDLRSNPIATRGLTWQS